MKLNILLLSILLSISINAQKQLSALVPMPNKIAVPQGKPFVVPKSGLSISISSDDLQNNAERTRNILRQRMGSDATVVKSGKAHIKLSIDTRLQGNEHYTLNVGSQGITITGATPAAIFHAITTLDQILMGDAASTAKKSIMPVAIDDSPRFPVRAIMLDPARNFLPADDVKFFIDQMVLFKYNTLQLHLTDDEGWRVNIPRHPSLASKQHYTRQELEDIIAYASDRYIDIIPEIDIPGHTVALLSAYPAMGCSHTDTLPKIVGKTTNMVLCPAKEIVYDVFHDVIDEISSIFPSKFIHLGGDEAAIEKHWTKCTDCQELMRQKNFTSVSQLMIPFFDRMLQFVRDNNKKPVLWCELDNIYPPANEYLFPYPKDVTLITWRNGLTPKCIELTAKHGNPLIMAPGEHNYLDYPQYKGDLPEFNNWGMPTTTLEKSYKLDPGYGLPPAGQAHIQGVMATMWGEAIKDVNRLNYMAFPRAIAIAEAGWTNMESRDWQSFIQRLYPNLDNLAKRGVSYRVPFEISGRKQK